MTTSENNSSADTEITIAGSAGVSTRPDAISLRITLKSIESAYDVALRSVDHKTQQLHSIMAECSLVGPVTTDNFGIDEVWHDPYDSEKRRLAGYCAAHVLVVTMPLDMALLDRFLQAIGHTDINPAIRVTFALLDPGPLLNQARNDALNSARTTAHSIATQMGLRITGIQSIKYSPPRVSNPSSLSLDLPEKMGSSPSMSIELSPEDITVRDDVTIIWKASPE